MSLRLGSPHPTRPVQSPADCLFSLPLFSYGQPPLPCTAPLCLVLISLDMLWDSINFLSTFNFSQLSLLFPNRASLLQVKLLAYLPLSWPYLIVISQVCICLPHFFSWKCLTLRSLCFKTWFKSHLFWDSVTNSSSVSLLHHLFVSSVLYVKSYVWLCRCCYHSNLPLNITLIGYLLPFPSRFQSKTPRSPGGSHHFCPPRTVDSQQV